MSRVTQMILFVAPLFAIAFGALVAQHFAISPGVFIPNLIAVIAGVSLASVITRSSLPRRASISWALSIVLILTLLATLVAPGLNGVHRWIPLGPAQLNVSCALLPWILAGTTATHPLTRLRSVILLAVVQAIHFAQPDAAQATVLAIAAIPLLSDESKIPPRVGIGLVVLLLALAAVTWTRAAPLLPLPHVEQILRLAAQRGALWIAFATVASLLLATAPIAVARANLNLSARVGYAFSLYFLTQLAVTCADQSPVPLFGAGAGPVFGWYSFATILVISTARSARRLPLNPT